METLQEIQQENRKLILESIHGVNYDLEKIAQNFLLDENSDGPCGYGQWIVINNDSIYKFYPDSNDDFVERDYLMTTSEFFGKFLTLSRVLLALEKQFKNEYHKMIFQDGQLFFICAETPVCQFYWSLEKETIEEQNEETQRRINQLLKGQ